MDKKYQIFVSSTYEDLKTERQQAIKAILEMGHIPVGMEMFSAGDETQWQLIKRQISDCDYYIVIAAHRYGSMDGDISYTEKEYNFAVESGVPTIGFIINEKARWPKTKIDMEQDKIMRLALFKQRIQQKVVSYWSNSLELKSNVSISLINQMNLTPRPGWAKAGSGSSPEALNEISRLSKENSELRSKIKLESEIESIREEKNIEKIEKLLELNSIFIGFMYEKSRQWENGTLVTYSKIFDLLAPELQIGSQDIKRVCHFLGIVLNPTTERKVRSSYPVGRNKIRRIMNDLMIMGLVKVANLSNNDGIEFYEITDLGKTIYIKNRMRMLENNYPKDEISDD